MDSLYLDIAGPGARIAAQQGNRARSEADRAAAQANLATAQVTLAAAQKELAGDYAAHSAWAMTLASQYATAGAALAQGYATFAAGIAAVADGGEFSVVDDQGRWINIYRKGASADADHPIIRVPGAAGYAGTGGGGLLGWLQAGSAAGAEADNIQRKFEESVSVKDYGAVGGNVVKDTDALLTAIAKATTASLTSGGQALGITIPYLGGGDLFIDPNAISAAFDAISNNTLPITITTTQNGAAFRPSQAADHLFRLGGSLITFQSPRITDPAGFIGSSFFYANNAPSDYPVTVRDAVCTSGNNSQVFIAEVDGAYRFELFNPRGQNVGGFIRHRSAGVQSRISGGGYLSGGTYRAILMDGTTSPNAQAEGFRAGGGLAALMNGAPNTIGFECLMGLDFDVDMDVNQLGAGGKAVRVAPPAGKSVGLGRFSGFVEAGTNSRAIELIGTSDGNIGDIRLNVKMGNGSSAGINGLYARYVQRLTVDSSSAFYIDGRALDIDNCSDFRVMENTDLRGAMDNLIGANVTGEFLSAFGAPPVRYPAMAYPKIWTGYTPGVRAASGVLGSYAVDVAKWRRDGQTIWMEFSIRITANGTGGGAIVIDLPIPVNAGSVSWAGREDGLSGASLQGQASDGEVIAFTFNNQYPGGTGAIIRLAGRAEIRP